MSNLVIIALKELALGFRLAGLEVRETTSADETQAHLETCVNEPTVTTVVVPEEHMVLLDDRTREHFAELDEPLIAPIPMGHTEDRDAHDYVKEIVRRAIGYEVRV